MKLVLFQAVLLAFQGVTYTAIQKFERPVHDVALPIDQKIPFVSQTVYIYGLWYPLIAVFPILLYFASPHMYSQYIASILIDIGISLLVYAVYPTSFKRPQPKTEKPSDKIIGWLYTKGNYKGKNCMPSMHCSMCFIVIVFALCCGDMLVWIRILTCLLAIMIVISTVLTKQHVMVDMVAAVPLAAVCCSLSFGIYRLC